MSTQPGVPQPLSLPPPSLLSSCFSHMKLDLYTHKKLIRERRLSSHLTTKAVTERHLHFSNKIDFPWVIALKRLNFSDRDYLGYSAMSIPKVMFTYDMYY